MGIPSAPSMSFPSEVIDAHIHFSLNYSGGLPNSWLPTMPLPFQRDFTEQNFRDAVSRGSCPVQSAIFVECWNIPASAEAKWVLEMVQDPSSIVKALVWCSWRVITKPRTRVWIRYS